MRLLDQHGREIPPESNAAALPACPACCRPSAGLALGDTCGRDDCPGEATRERVTDFGPVPPPRPREWAKVTGLRVSARKVEPIEPPREPLGEPYRYPPGIPWEDVPQLRRPWWTRAWRWATERWVGMWARIAQFMGVSLDG